MIIVELFCALASCSIKIFTLVLQLSQVQLHCTDFRLLNILLCTFLRHSWTFEVGDLLLHKGNGDIVMMIKMMLIMMSMVMMMMIDITGHLRLEMCNCATCGGAFGLRNFSSNLNVQPNVLSTTYSPTVVLQPNATDYTSTVKLLHRVHLIPFRLP